MAHHGKRYKKAIESYNQDDLFVLGEAVKMIKQNANTKFDESVDIAINLGIDPRHSDQMVRGTVALPNGTGKVLRVAVFAKGDKVKEAEDAGADIVGSDDLAEKIMKGEINFDRCIATPDMMVVVGKLGKVLGPRGLMPNPKLGTVTPNVAQAVKDVKGGQVEFRAEKAGVVHAGVGRASFSEQALGENVRAFFGAIMKAKPPGAKGVYVKKVSISSTMGPGVKLDIASLGNA